MSRTQKPKNYAYGSDPDLEKALPKRTMPCERDVRVAVEHAVREVAVSFSPDEVHSRRFALAASVAVLAALRCGFEQGWERGNGFDREEEDASED